MPMISRSIKRWWNLRSLEICTLRWTVSSKVSFSSYKCSSLLDVENFRKLQHGHFLYKHVQKLILPSWNKDELKNSWFCETWSLLDETFITTFYSYLVNASFCLIPPPNLVNASFCLIYLFWIQNYLTSRTWELLTN